MGRVCVSFACRQLDVLAPGLYDVDNLLSEQQLLLALEATVLAKQDPSDQMRMVGPNCLGGHRTAVVVVFFFPVACSRQPRSWNKNLREVKLERTASRKRKSRLVCSNGVFRSASSLEVLVTLGDVAGVSVSF